MGKKVIRLTESDLTKIVRRVINESANTDLELRNIMKMGKNFFQGKGLSVDFDLSIHTGKKESEYSSFKSDAFHYKKSYSSNGRYRYDEKKKGQRYEPIQTKEDIQMYLMDDSNNNKIVINTWNRNKLEDIVNTLKEFENIVKNKFDGVKTYLSTEFGTLRIEFEY